jgi:thiosulfate/3-mercaptopyruvate sulfurtransferase
LEGWEKVILSSQEFTQTIHGEMGCIACHGGDGAADDKETAHLNMRREPIAAEACYDCHTDMVSNEDSLHSNLTGYYTVLQERSSPETWPHVEEAFGNHCENCHTSCGQCHVSRPTNLGGGLSAGHQFKQIPPMNLTCTGCHGSRVEMEYKGKNEGIPADIHWTKGGMPCFACHTADEMHGKLDFESNHRYDGPQMPACVNCHPNVLEKVEFKEHLPIHTENLACQVCHVADYKNCYSCHVQKSEEGTPYFKIEPSVMDVKIGYNPNPSEERPWKWVTLRHVPIDPDSFEYYGEDLLPNFDSRPTWAYATPHNIQRRPPQAETCNNCHGNPEVFLTKDDLLPYEIEANKNVIVDENDIPSARE